MPLSRRSFLQVAGVVGAASAANLMVPLSGLASAESRLPARHRPTPFTAPFRRPPVLKPYARDVVDGRPTDKYVITQQAALASILPGGLMTPVLAYNGIVPGPTIRATQGVPVEVAMRNQIAGENPFSRKAFRTITHLHGSASLPQYDGYAAEGTPYGEVKTYRYPNWQRGRTMWYHDHNIHTTAENVYAGLAGTYHLVDDATTGAQLPQGEFDVPLVLSDALFAADGRLVFDDQGHDGLWGDVVLVNGVPWPEMTVKPRVYRFRLVNASIARSYRPRLSPDLGMTVVASDAGLFPEPKTVSSFRQSNGERYEVLIDFRGLAPGATVDLRNLSNKNNDDFTHTNKIMRFRVVADTAAPDTYRVPRRLSRGAPLDDHPEVRDLMSFSAAEIAALPVARRFELSRGNGQWQINRRTWADVERSGFTLLEGNPQPYDVEVWEVANTGGGWFHPFHVHLADARVVRRNTNGGRPFDWELGPKDTFYIGENEVVRLLMQFELGPGNSGGRYMIHCHNASHEDHDMMVQYAIGDPAQNDPLTSAPASVDRGGWPAPVYA